MPAQVSLADSEPSTCRLRPKPLKAIKEERLAAREQIKAAQHVMQHVGLDLDLCVPGNPLRQPMQGEHKHTHVVDGVNMTYLTDAQGTCTWNTPEKSDHLRLVLNPDQGSALFCGYEWLAQQNMAISFRRDELRPDCTKIWRVLPSRCNANMNRSIFKHLGTSSRLIATAS